MVVEHLTPFSEWFYWFLVQSGGAVLLLAALGLLLGFLRAMSAHGPGEGFLMVSRVIGTAFFDLAQISPRRTYAMARLAFQEAVRRKVLVAFAVFLAVLLFAGWFLDVRSDHPARLYLEFVLTSTTYLVLLLGLFLSTLSLPNDIKQHTIYTVVTKPVRASEIVLGRILGFTGIGTFVIVVMWAVSYVFVVRGLSHEHEADLASFAESDAAASAPAGGSDVKPEKKTKRRRFETLGGEETVAGSATPSKIVRNGQTTQNSHHRHRILVRADGVAYTEEAQDHRHPVLVAGEGENATYTLGPPQGMLQARVPVYGDLRFLDRAGNPGKGVNVGNEWMYRSFIEGRTPAAAIWMFRGVNQQKFGEQLAVELNLRVFRTWKGDIESAVLGSLVLQNPTTGMRSEKFYLHPREFSLERVVFPRKLNAVREDRTTYEVDLFNDLVDEHGNLEILVRCEESGQYYGMAPADVYLRAGDRWFGWNFFKGYVTIWYQMLIVISFGVMFSTFLSGPVAVLATLSTLVMGYNKEFVLKLIYGVFGISNPDALEGGGPIEALVRLVTQSNMTTPLQSDTGTRIIQFFDQGLTGALAVVIYMLPDYSQLTTSDYVAYGYDIAWGLLLQHGLKAIFFLAVMTGLGYFFLRTREIAA